MAVHIELRELRLFVGVAESRSFSACADKYGISQPALSRTIRQMEERLGARLFDRDTRTVNLSAAGEHLLPTAERIIREVDLGLQGLKQFVTGSRGRIVAACLPSLSASLLPGAIASFKTEAPDVEFEIIDGLSGDVIEAVLQGKADLGLALRPVQDSALEYREICLDPFGLVCRDDDPLAQAPSASWTDFERRPFIAMAPHSSVRMMTDAAFIQIMAPIRPLYECSQMATAGALILNHLGISAMPRLAMPLAAPAGLAWRPLSRPSLKRSVGVVTRRNSTCNATVSAFVETLMIYSGNHAPSDRRAVLSRS